jgi:hypothetical protein
MRSPLSNWYPVRTVFAALALVSIAATSAQAQTLTDIVLFRADANGSTISEGWNTRGGDFISNLYLTSGGNFINSGNETGVPVALDLSVPGSYTFGFFGENVNSNTAPPLSLNLFFNGNAATPSISARGVNGGGFFPNSSASTSLPNFGIVPGANTLSFSNNGRQITLSAFTYQTATGTDQVSSFTNTPNGLGDTIGSFTLTVTSIAPSAAPEPSTFALLAFGSIAGVVAARRRKMGR